MEELNIRLIEGDQQPVKLEVGLKYNIDQIQDCEVALGLSFRRLPHTVPERPHKRSERLLDKLRSKQNLKTMKRHYAAYSPKHDYTMKLFHITTLDESKTTVEANYWATLWHEVIHWTGHVSRLNRKQHEQWGDDTYAVEELIAELGVDGEM
ncbi:MAG: zincin-like metallopeptidase domain-containing protein [Gammaproteobacteria bacterium]|nr:zincin-like metallopeptidase domain-containing protein [Gammaproteobacteria bacterium]MDE0251824.1 zincin-like metallopeptidase domain-containing protein [Gammaproteobacteria bacterium]MDE0403167.1 zincin-like metallopeptidase domain-containing protein [Gammaproteobacteria bacterium]